MSLLVCAAAFATAAISGTFGMAGGLILLGVYLAALPVVDAMLLHGITQLAANGSRCFLLRRFIDFRAVRRYFAGAGASFALFAFIAITVPKSIAFLLLGAVPLAAGVARQAPLVSIARPSQAIACGAIVTACHLTAGAAGALLDLFFLDGTLDRRQVVATKACTQCIGHLCKIAYFGVVIPAAAGPAAAASFSAWLYPALLACVFAGTAAGNRVLARMTDHRFQRWSRRLVTAISSLYLLQGLRLLLAERN
ncbi:MAG: sulfite exporter TauE/SafE family protein [Planctomycetes bacterium]|nr:sulfite exporter TauE/SafE family protein [Planctomycetota bacterium]